MADASAPHRIQGATGEWRMVVGLDVHAQVGEALDEQSVLNAALAFEERAGSAHRPDPWW